MAEQMYTGANAYGGYFFLKSLSEKVRMKAEKKCQFRRFCTPELKPGLHRGSQLGFDKISQVNTAGSTTGISETETIPETRVTVYQDTLTVTEFGHQVPYTGKLEALSELDVEDILVRALTEDMIRTLDGASAAQFRATDLVYVPTGTMAAPTYTLYTNGTPVVAAARNGQCADVKNIIDWFRTNNVAPWGDTGFYVCIATQQFLRGLYDDAEFVEDKRYGAPELSWHGEVRRWYQTLFFLETNVLSTNLGSASNLGEAIFFGLDPVMEGISIPEQIRVKPGIGDYGRDKGIAWYFLGGYKKTWDYSAEGEEHVIRVYTA